MFYIFYIPYEMNIIPIFFFLHILYSLYQRKMDNVARLLDEFHRYEDVNFENKHYLALINEIKMNRNDKIIALQHKASLRDKIMQRTKSLGRMSMPLQLKSNTLQSYQDEKSIGKINQDILLKEEEELIKCHSHLQQEIQQLQIQLSLFNKKDNQIKMFLYQSRRDRNHAQIQLKNQRKLLHERQQKHERKLQLLHQQADNLKHEIRYMAENLTKQEKRNKKEMVNLGKMLLNNIMLNTYDLDRKKREKQFQKFTKAKLQDTLRIIYIIQKMKESWNNRNIKTKKQIQEELKSVEEFRIFNKAEILEYYEGLGLLFKSDQITVDFVEFYENLSQNIDRLQRLSNQLNTAYIQFKSQNEQLEEIFNKLEQNHKKIALITLTEVQKGINCEKASFNHHCQLIFHTAVRMKNLILKSHRLIQMINFIAENSRKWIKGSDLTLRVSDDQNICRFSLTIQKNPEELAYKWNQTIGTDSEGQKFIQNLMENDLFRILGKPEDYSLEKNALQNEEIYSSKIFNTKKELFLSMKKKFIEIIQQVESKSHILSETMSLEKTEALVNNETQEDSILPTYIVESKEYYSRDNFGFLEKLEKLQEKKKGLKRERLGAYCDTEINDNDSKQDLSLSKHLFYTKRDYFKKNVSNKNFVSSYREKVNKASKKIRELLKNIENNPKKSVSASRVYRIKEKVNS